MALCCCGHPSWFFLAAQVLHQRRINNSCSCSGGSTYPSSFKGCRSPPLLSRREINLTALHTNVKMYVEGVCSTRELLQPWNTFCFCFFVWTFSPLVWISRRVLFSFSSSLDWVEKWHLRDRKRETKERVRETKKREKLRKVRETKERERVKKEREKEASLSLLLD